MCVCVCFCIHAFSDPLKRFLPAIVTCDGSFVESSGLEKVKKIRDGKGPSDNIIRSSARTHTRFLSQSVWCLWVSAQHLQHLVQRRWCRCKRWQLEEIRAHQPHQGYILPQPIRWEPCRGHRVPVICNQPAHRRCHASDSRLDTES